MRTKRLTMAQALVAFLKKQFVERDGGEYPFFYGDGVSSVTVVSPDSITNAAASLKVGFGLDDEVQM